MIANELAKQLLKTAKQNEPTITKDLHKISNFTQAQ